jgi:PadR family transcriptional regulator, regulatory protein AphA
LQIRDELLLKILFGTFATPEALASHIRAAIIYHEQRLIEYRQNLSHMPARGIPMKRGAYYTDEALGSDGDAYFNLVGRFAVAFEQT